MQEPVMLNEVKHLVLRTDGCFFPGARFFVALLLRLTRAKGFYIINIDSREPLNGE